MPRRGDRKARLPVGDPSDPHGMAVMLDAFLQALRVAGYSEATISGRDAYLRRFALWCSERSVSRPSQVTRELLERYQRQLYQRRKRDGQRISHYAQLAPLLVIRAFFRWLARRNLILYNPASELELPRTEQTLPKSVLSVAEAEAVLAQPVLAEPLGLRDRALLETLYSTGLRRLELCRLAMEDLDAGRGTLLVRQGKGKRDRLVPIGERALSWVSKYLSEVRPSLLRDPAERTLFLTRDGLPMIPNSLTNLVRRYIRQADLPKGGSCHTFRHTMATLMLEGGADIRYIQQMLGHAHLSTTQIYTRVSIQQLKAVHDATHPAALLKRLQKRGEPNSDTGGSKGS